MQPREASAAMRQTNPAQSGFAYFQFPMPTLKLS